MGLKASAGGLRIIYCDEWGNPVEAPIHGASVELRGAERSDIVAAAPLSPTEEEEPGSDDWLTMVAVADSQERLKELLTDPGGLGGGYCGWPNTSAFSRRVEIRTHVGPGAPRIETGRITLAEGPILSETEMEVEVLRVMGTGAVVDDQHPLRDDFARAKSL